MSGSDRFGPPAGLGWVRDSISPSPAAPARCAPPILNVACQTRSTSAGLSGVQPVAAGQLTPGPGIDQHTKMPDQQRGALIAVAVEGLVCRQVAAGADTDLQPPAAHQVEYRGVLG